MSDEVKGKAGKNDAVIAAVILAGLIVINLFVLQLFIRTVTSAVYASGMDIDPAKIEVSHMIKGSGGENDSYTFVLARETEDAPMPGGALSDSVKLTIKGKGNASFSDITFTTPDVYRYTLREVKGENSKAKYDDTVYEIEVIAQNALAKASESAGSDGTGRSTVIIIKKKGASAKSEKAVFTDTFETAGTSGMTHAGAAGLNGAGSIVKTGDIGNYMALMVLIAALAASIITGIAAKKQNSENE